MRTAAHSVVIFVVGVVLFTNAHWTVALIGQFTVVAVIILHERLRELEAEISPILDQPDLHHDPTLKTRE